MIVFNENNFHATQEQSNVEFKHSVQIAFLGCKSFRAPALFFLVKMRLTIYAKCTEHESFSNIIFGDAASMILKNANNQDDERGQDIFVFYNI